MSMDLFPFEMWPSGDNNASVPANNNAIRYEAVSRPVISKAVTAQPTTPADGDLYIIPAGATGTVWATFTTNSLAIFYDGTWTEFPAASFPGLMKVVNGALEYFDGADWVPLPTPAVSIGYDNAASGLTATNIQDAIDELDAAVDALGGAVDAVDVVYDNASSGLTATDVQGAVDELSAAVGALGGGPEAVPVLSISSGTVTVDCATGRTFTLTLNANVTTLTLTNVNATGFVTEIELVITQDGTGGRTFALPASFKKLGDSDTAVASAANAVTVLSAKTVNGGTTWYYAMQERAA